MAAAHTKPEPERLKNPSIKSLLGFLTASSPIISHVSALALSLDEKRIWTDMRNAIFGGSRLAAFEQTTLSGLEPVVFPLEVADRGLMVWLIDPAVSPTRFNVRLTTAGPLVQQSEADWIRCFGLSQAQ